MKQRQPLVVGNWKMNKGVNEALELVTAIKNSARPAARQGDVEIVVVPPYTALYPVAKKLEGSPVLLGAQNCYWEPSGAFTGEVSPPMLAELGCRYVIVGHSERRQHFHETDALINLKAKAVLRAGMRPILCIGETLAERDAGEMPGRLVGQLAEGLFGFTPAMLSDAVIAYEPIWAIGTGRVATTEQAQEVHRFIRGYLHNQLGEVASTVRILYGGSVKPNNTAGLMAQPDVDGVLVGGASLKAEDFLHIVRYNETAS